MAGNFFHRFDRLNIDGGQRKGGNGIDTFPVSSLSPVMMVEQMRKAVARALMQVPGTPRRRQPIASIRSA